MTQDRQNLRPKLKHQRKQNAAFEAQADREGQSTPRADRGAHHGQWWEGHGRALLHLRPCVVATAWFSFTRLFVFFTFLPCFAL
jgi:hypothetical protein